MGSFVSSGYGVILLIWGIAFELVGTGIVVLINRAIRREEQEERVSKSALPSDMPIRPADERPLARSARQS